jgi:ribonuclease J
LSNENNNQFNNEARENHDGQFGHGQKRPYNRPKNYKYKPQHRNSYGRKPMQDRKAPADKEKNGIQVPFKAAIKNSSRRPKKPTSKLKIIPLGGLEQIGMNITAFEYEDSIVVVDCGLAFPEDDMLGIDLVIPDVTYLKENISKVKGFVITHGHEDHIGALPYILKEVNVPVYSTKLTLGLITNKLKEHNLVRSTKLKEVKHGQVINLGDFSIEFIKTNHSIQDASALAIYSPAGIVVHTGDFKVDYTPVNGEPIDLQRFAELGKKGVLALMCDSTNALRPGFTMSERTVGSTFDKIFNDNKNSRIIIATFASNVDRVQQIINAAVAYGRKVCVEGRSMVNIIDVAEDLGYLHIPDGTLIETEAMKNYTPEQIVLITTGSQGESMAALSRMAANLHRKVSIQPGDCVVFSSTPIPGNEKSVARVINELGMKGAKVIFQDTHVSGHACQEEIKLVYSLLKPKYAIPVHGEYRHLIAQKEVAMSLGYDKEDVIIAKSGDVIELSDEKAAIVGKVHTGAILVDGLGVGDVGNIVLRDRQNLAENGIIIVVLTLEKYTGQLVAGPDIVTRGFVYVREAEELLDEARAIVTDSVLRCLDKNITDWSKIKNIIKDDLSEYLWKKMKRNPVILPIIMEAQM